MLLLLHTASAASSLLLQTRFIVACIASAVPITATTDAADFAAKAFEVSGYFGAVPKASLTYKLLGFDAGDLNAQLQVRMPCQQLLV